MTDLADQLLTYDAANRHMGTTHTQGTPTTADDVQVTYVRDATGRVISRTLTEPGQAAKTVKYLYGASGLFGTDDTSSAAGTNRSISLPGWVIVSYTGKSLAAAAATDGTWSYRNLHGDVIMSTDKSNSGGVLARAGTDGRSGKLQVKVAAKRGKWVAIVPRPRAARSRELRETEQSA